MTYFLLVAAKTLITFGKIILAYVSFTELLDLII